MVKVDDVHVTRREGRGGRLRWCGSRGIDVF